MRSDAHKKKKKRIKIRWGRFIPAMLVLCLIVLAAVVVIYPAPKKDPEPIDDPTKGQEPIEEPDPTVSLSIRCVGDIMAHMPQVNGAAKSDGTYDFSVNYQYVTDLIQAADLALGNIETTFSGDGTYGGFPAFDSPEALARDVAAAGFDVALFANNHMLDTKLAGAKNTVKVLRENNMATVGARTDTADDRSIIVEVKGLKIGIVAYTYETATKDGKRSMNGSYNTGMNSGAPDYINTFRYYTGSDKKSHVNEDDLASIKNELAWCRENGAELVIAYFHWGSEYHNTPNNADVELARFAAENGADMIFGSHPHILQGMTTIEVETDFLPEPEPEPIVEPEPVVEPEPEEKEFWIIRLKRLVGLIKEEEPEEDPEPVVEPEPEQEEPKPTSYIKQVPVYYSMGNFISNQRYETLASSYGETAARRTEQGMIACVDITYNKKTGEVTYDRVEAIPTWVSRYGSSSRYTYQIVPLLGNFETNPALANHSGYVTRAKNALTYIKELLGENHIYSGAY